MYKSIIFDLDGTLLDSSMGILEAVQITLKELNMPMLPPEILKTFIGPPIQNSLEKHFGLTSAKAMEIANKFRANYKEYSLLQATLYPGILELCAKLKAQGHKLAVATYKSHDNAMKILEHFGFMEYCDYALGSDKEGKYSKADIIRLCIEQLGSDLDECVMIGDSKADADGARKVGIDFIALTYGFGFKPNEALTEINPIAVCNDVQELEKFFLKTKIKA